MSEIHPTAVVHPDAKLASTVQIGPFSIVDRDVSIGEETQIDSHCLVTGRTSIGRNNRIYNGCSVGTAPQDKKYKGEATYLEIGDRNMIREFCTINTGTTLGGGTTRIGSNNWIMAYVHIAHDCRIGNDTTIANGVQIGGHVVVGDYCTIGGVSGIHQLVRIGTQAMVGAHTPLNRDLPPFIIGFGNPAAEHGVNRRGLERRGFEGSRIIQIEQIYHILYSQGLGLNDAMTRIAKVTCDSPESTQDVEDFLRFLEESQRGQRRLVPSRPSKI